MDTTTSITFDPGPYKVLFLQHHYKKNLSLYLQPKAIQTPLPPYLLSNTIRSSISASTRQASTLPQAPVPPYTRPQQKASARQPRHIWPLVLSGAGKPGTPQHHHQPASTNTKRDRGGGNQLPIQLLSLLIQRLPIPFRDNHHLKTTFWITTR